MRGWSICFFINLFVCFHAKSQPYYAMPFNKKIIDYDTTERNINAPAPFLRKPYENPFNGTSIKRVPTTFYFNSIGFFCQKELQLEKALRFPVKVRLGSVAYTDQMEGKGTYIPDNAK